MSAQSLFGKKNIQSKQADSPGGLLEELNLPPGVIAFFRKNARTLQVGMICGVVLVLAWVSYSYYSGIQEKKGASLLATGMQTESSEQRVQILENVIKDYGRTSAARWSKLELANLEYKDGRYAEAATKYEDILDALPAKNPLTPLTRLNLAQCYEQMEQYDKAIAQYNLLKKSPGFANQAYLGLGRLYMTKNDTVQAGQAYKEYLGNMGDRPDPAIKSRIEAKLAALDSDKPAPTPPPAENKE
jgi:predicted negative regulator of RcsB-dependent stress response